MFRICFLGPPFDVALNAGPSLFGIAVKTVEQRLSYEGIVCHKCGMRKIQLQMK
jgi:hypothetical protein